MGWAADPLADYLSFLGFKIPSDNQHHTLLVDSRVAGAAVVFCKIPHLPTDSQIEWHAAAAQICQKASFGVEVAQTSRQDVARLLTAALVCAGFAKGPCAPEIIFNLYVAGHTINNDRK